MKNSLLFLSVFWLLFTYSEAKSQLSCTLDPSSYQYTMTVTAVLNIDGVEATTTTHELGAYVHTQSGTECRGTANLQEVGGRYYAFLTVYSNQATGESVIFKMWDGSTEIAAVNVLSFQINAVVGSISDPYVVSNNNPPTDIELSSTTIEENQPVGTVVGTFSTTDPDDPDNLGIYTYNIISGYEDFDQFSIDGDQLKTAAEFDIETKTNYTIKVETDDGNGGIYQEIFTITVIDDNDTPTDIQLSATSVFENSAIGTEIGTLTTTDQDPDDVHEYTLFDAVTYPDNNSFIISGSTLQLNSNLNFEVKPVYTVNIQTEDQSSQTFTKEFFINVLDANDAPTNIFYYETGTSSATIAENSSLNSIVGTLTTTDEDVTDTHSYTFTTGSGENNNNLFVIDGTLLRTNTTLDFETKEFYYVHIQTEDAGGATYSRQLTIQVIDANDAPTDLTISDNTVSENLTIGTTVGVFSTTDSDIIDDHSYSLVSGIGGDDNASFSIVNNELKTSDEFDFESKSSYKIRIQTKDKANSTLQKQFTITIIDENDAPSEIQLSSTNIIENSSVGTSVGSFSTSDQDTWDTHLYTLATGTGDTDNSSFIIQNNELKTNTTLNFENKNSYSILVKTTDIAGSSHTNQFTISVTDGNDIPTAITFIESTQSSATVEENKTIGTVVSTLQSADQDIADTHSYKLVTGVTGYNNNSFTIVGNLLKTNQVFDYETKRVYYILVETNDGNGGTYQEELTVHINNANDAPTDIALSNNTVSENLASNALVGILTSTDPDNEPTFVYSLESGIGDDDNASFNIINTNELVAVPTFDYETKSTYKIRIQTQDAAGTGYQEQFIVTIIDENDTPTDIQLSSVSIIENSEVGTVVGTFSTSDQDTWDSFVYTLTNGTGDTDNNSFAIEGNQLKTNVNLDYESQTSYSILVKTMDIAGTSHSEQFTLSVNNANDTPTRIVFAGNSMTTITIPENKPIGTEVGTLSTYDQDVSDTHTYRFLAGDGSYQNSAFIIEGDKLKVNKVFDYETERTFYVFIETDDGHGGKYSQELTIQVSDRNDSPTQLLLSNNTVSENKSIGTLVGNFSTIDPDALDMHQYTLVSGSGDTDNGKFQIVDNQLLTNAIFNYEGKSQYTIRVQTDDSNGGTYQKQFYIAIIDANDTPTNIELSSQVFYENAPLGTTIGSMSTEDQDVNDSFSYSFASCASNLSNYRFIIEGNLLKTNDYFDYETESTDNFYICIQVNDGHGGTYTEQINLRLLNANDAPSAVKFVSTNTNSITFAENQPEAMEIGNFKTTDQDASDSHTYQFAYSDEENDNDYFEIDGNTLKSADSFDYESKEFYYIYIQTNDGNGGTYTQQMTVQITNANDAPTDITLSDNNIDENKPLGTKVCTLISTDIDPSNTFTYTLVSGVGDTDNDKFAISGNDLTSKTVFNYEEQNEYSIRIRTTDQSGAYYEEAFTILINDKNDTPLDIILSTTSVGENLPAGTLVGNLTTTDPDTWDTHTYSFVDGTNDNSKFSISGNQILTAAKFNYEVKSTYTIQIRTTDIGGKTYQEDIEITIIDNNDAPTALTLTSTEINENASIGSLVGQLVTTDADPTDTHIYTFVGEENDNTFFVIDGDELRTNAIFDFETKKFYSIEIQSDDGNGGLFSKQFTLSILDTNDEPVSLSVSNASVNENAPSGTYIGTFTTSDPDVADTHTYRLAEGIGDEHNDLFQISGNKLQTVEIFNYENQNMYSIFVETDDGNGGVLGKQFDITINDANDTPIAISLSNNIVSENQPTGTVIGVLSTTDEDAATSFTYTLVQGTGDEDNGFFSIENNLLKTASIFNYEQKNSFTIRIRTTDVAGAYYEEQFIITVSDGNDKPLDISLAPKSIYENVPIGTVIGTFTTTDPDETDSHTYSFISGTEANDNSSFAIDGNQLKVNTTLNYEAKNYYYINVQTDDNNGGVFAKQFTIQILDANDAPTSLSITSNTIQENMPVGSLVGVLQTIDPDAANTHTYTLADGIGSTDNAMFSINNNTLISAVEFNFEARQSYSVYIETDDGNGGVYGKQFNITITDANDAPTNLLLSKNTIAENLPMNTTVCMFTTSDADTWDSFSYALVDGEGATDNPAFFVDDNVLKTTGMFDFETKATYEIRLQTTDQQGATFSKAFIIHISNGNDLPTDIQLSNNELPENQPIGTVIGTLSVSDQDDSDVHILSLVSGNESNDNDFFIISGNELKTAAEFNYENKVYYSILVEANDGHGGTYTKQFIITILNANDPPVAVSLSSTSVAENKPTGTTVGVLTTTDVDPGNTYTYELIAGVGDDDNLSFTIADNKLKTAQIFNFEEQEQYSIRIRAYDNEMEYVDRQFIITIQNGNDLPTAINLTKNQIEENQPIGTVIGLLSATDEDFTDTHTYSFSEGEGDTDNFKFNIESNQLKTASLFNFEAENTYTIRIQASDASGGTFSRQFTITITDANDAPTNISLSPNAIAENNPIGSVVGTFTTSDPDVSDLHIYTLIEGTGSDHNELFIIDEDELKTATNFDYEDQVFYSIRVRSIDETGLYTEKQFTITILNANDAPQSLELSSVSIEEDAPVGTVIGTFSTTDPDQGDLHIYGFGTSVGNDTDNDKFIIEGNSLKTNIELDYETKNSYSIYVYVDDNNGGVFARQFTIYVIGVNDPPTEISLYPAHVEENVPIGTVIGAMEATDTDDDTHLFTLVPGVGDADNSKFVIDGNNLITNSLIDYEAQSSFTVRVKATDAESASYERQFNISAIDLNDAPTEITLSPADIAENSPVGTYVGIFATTDQDSGDEHTYGLVTEAGNNNNNDCFVIVDNELRTNCTFDFEIQKFYYIYIESNDGNGGTKRKQFTITVTDNNDAPTDISLSNNVVLETEPIGSKIGTFLSTDQDQTDAHSYSFASGIGDDDNANFIIVGSELRTNALFDMENQVFHNILIKTDDGNGGTFIKPFIIEISDGNDPPTGLAISSTSVEENQPAGAIVGTFITEDPDATPGEGHTYTLIPGEGDDDNSKFSVQGDKLVTATVLDFETQQEYLVRIQTDDKLGGLLEHSFTITALDINDKPTAIDIDSKSIAENQSIGTIIGNISTTDQDASDSHYYSLVEGTGSDDNNAFIIDGAMLKSARRFDFENKQYYNIRLRTEDRAGASHEQQFTISIENQDDPPTDIILSGKSIQENLAPGTSIGLMQAIDPNASQGDTYMFSFADGENDNAYFVIENNKLMSGISYNYETKSSYIVDIQVQGKGGSFTKQFTITILDENETPYNISLSRYGVEEHVASGSLVGTISVSDYDLDDSHVYSLTTTMQGNDNHLFVIEGDQLKTATVFDREIKMYYTIYIEVTDNGGNTFGKLITIEILDTNDLPAQLSLSSQEVNENETVGSVVGILTTIDADAADNHSYSLVDGIGDDDNTRFSITGDKLVTTETFDYETASLYSVRIQTNDGNGGTLERQFNIEINDANDAPVGLSLNPQIIPENSAIGSIVGSFATSDPDAADSHTYQLVAGESDTDNANFIIEGYQLKTASELNYEEQEFYSIRVQTTDAEGATLQQVFTITVKNANDAPELITLSNTVVSENKPAGYTIGTFSTTDPDVSDVHSYSFVTGTESNDNHLFIIEGNQLKTNAVFNYEDESQYSIYVQTNDGKGGTYRQSINISIANDNDAPSALSLSGTSVSELMPAGTLVATLSTTDVDQGDTHTYTLTDGVGADDNHLFQISDNRLLTAAEFDFESKNVYTILLMTEDQSGGQFKKQVTIYITDANDIPLIDDQTFTVDENSDVLVIIGRVEAEDVDAGQTLSYSIIGGNNAKMFAINVATGEITVNSPLLDFEETPVYELTVKVTDNGNEYLSETATITVQLNNQNEVPIISDQRFYISESAELDAVVGTVAADDTDADYTLLYRLEIENYEQYDGEFPFEIDEFTGELTVRNRSLLDYEMTPYFTFDVVVTDEGGLDAVAEITVMIEDAVEATIKANNYFSPNNDGMNDYWEIKNPELYDGFKVMIFNGAGELLYESDNYQNDWDGTYEGEQLPEGTYYYIMKSEDGEYVYKGTISLVR